MSPHHKAILFSIGSYACWVVNDTLWKLLGASGLPSIEVLGISSAVTAATIVALSALRGRLWALKTKRIKFELARSALLLMVALSGFIALANFPITLFYVATFAAPIISAALAIVILREKPSFAQIGAIVAGFIGVIVAVNPFDVSSVGALGIGYVAMAICPIIIAMMSIMTKTVCLSETTDSISFIPQLVRTLVFVPISLFWFELPDFREWLYMFAAGFVNAFAYLFAALALKQAPVSVVAPFHYSQIILGAAAGFAIWGYVPTWNLWLGAVIIVASGIYITISNEAKEAVNERSAPTTI